MEITVHVKKIVGTTNDGLIARLSGYIPLCGTWWTAGDVVISEATIVTNMAIIPFGNYEGFPSWISADWKIMIGSAVPRLVCKSVLEERPMSL